MPIAIPVTPTASPILRLAVLEFETPPDDIFLKHGTYGDIAIKSLRRNIASTSDHPPLLKTTKISVLEGNSWPDLDTIDAVLITGSMHTASDDDVWVPSLTQFIRQVYNARKPLAGICYGHQMIARALGGRTSRNPQGWELSVHQVDFAPLGVETFGRASFNIYEIHRDAVIETPPNVQVIASSSGCDVQVMYQPGRVLGFQGHPEIDRSVTECMLRQRLDEGILELSVYEDAMSRIEIKEDGDRITTAMGKFFLGARSLVS
ncbi:GMP synthase [Mariannaea sp. PMI_226]|nr:GMP synthase [Mariannaea sp. PMI_226]